MLPSKEQQGIAQLIASHDHASRLSHNLHTWSVSYVLHQPSLIRDIAACTHPASADSIFMLTIAWSYPPHMPKEPCRALESSRVDISSPNEFFLTLCHEQAGGLETDLTDLSARVELTRLG